MTCTSVCFVEIERWRVATTATTTNLDERFAFLTFSFLPSFLSCFFNRYNHRNGHWFNTKSSQEREEGHEVRARRTIEAGEEIFNSYNLCDECESRHHGYGTPGT